LSQPFEVAEVFTGIKGARVSIEDTIKGFSEICSGKHDAVPEKAFFMASTIEDVLEKARSGTQPSPFLHATAKDVAHAQNHKQPPYNSHFQNNPMHPVFQPKFVAHTQYNKTTTPTSPMNFLNQNISFGIAVYQSSQSINRQF
jgi:hypothetical protein